MKIPSTPAVPYPLALNLDLTGLYLEPFFRPSESLTLAPSCHTLLIAEDTLYQIDEVRARYETATPIPM